MTCEQSSWAAQCAAHCTCTPDLACSKLVLTGQRTCTTCLPFSLWGLLSWLYKKGEYIFLFLFLDTNCTNLLSIFCALPYTCLGCLAPTISFWAAWLPQSASGLPSNTTSCMFNKQGSGSKAICQQHDSQLCMSCSLLQYNPCSADATNACKARSVQAVKTVCEAPIVL